MSTLLKLAIATAMLTATVGLSQAQQGRSIEVIPAQGSASQAQTFAQAPNAEAPAPEAPAAEPAAPEQAEPAAPQQAAPIPQPPQGRAERLPVRPLPAPKQVEKCHDERPVYSQAQPRYQAPRYEEPRYYAPRYERHSYAPRYDYAPRQSYGGYRGGY
jgi:hypothetical protein